MECTGVEELPHENAPRDVWKLYVDGSATDNASGAGIILVTPTGHKFHSALKFKFEATNNESEYEALLAGLRMAIELKAKAIRCYSDSQLVINQILGDYQARGTRMAAHLEKVKTTFKDFEFYSVERIPREDNPLADALARLATSKEAEELSIVPVEVLHEPSIVQSREIELIEEKTTWMTSIIAYLFEGTLPEDRIKARRLMYQLPRYTMLDGKLYRRGYSMPFLKCVAEPEVSSILREVHEGFCGGHTRGHSLARKVIRQG